MNNFQYCNEILSIIGDVSTSSDAIYNLAYDVYQKLGGQESQPSLETIYNELKQSIQIWDDTDSLNITENGTYNLLGKSITVNIQCSIPEIPYNELWYTTFNGNKIENNFTNTAKSNEYDQANRRWVLTFVSNINRLIGAFPNQPNLSTITIPGGVTVINSNAFYRNALTTIVIDPINTVYDSRNNCNAIISTSTNTLIVGCQNTVIPDSVVKISSAAFYECNGLTTFIIPDNITEIGQTAFYNCYYMSTLTIGKNVTSIGDQAFSNCEHLTSISYNGTMAQWNAITKGNNWNYSVPATVVHCTDGDVAI